MEASLARADTGIVSRPSPPILTIWHDGSQHTFAAGHDVVIGRDADADIRIADPRISRAHLILRFEQGKWLAIDNGSVNGTFVNGYRRPVIDIHDGQSINIGNAGGPQLTLRGRAASRQGGKPPGAGSPRDADRPPCRGRRVPRPERRPGRTRRARSAVHDAAGQSPPPAAPRQRPAPYPATRRGRRRASIRPTCSAAATAGPPSDRDHGGQRRSGCRRRHTCRPPR